MGKKSSWSSKQISAESYLVMPWKNGMGKTSEICMVPADAARDQFYWRVSSAEVEGKGKFSTFPGYDRFLCLVRGRSLDLWEQGESSRMTVGPSQVIQFEGEKELFYDASQGRVEDLNLIIQRGHMKAQFELITLRDKPRSFEMQGNVAYLFVISGAVVVSTFPGETRYYLEERDTLQLGDSIVLIEAQGVQSQLAWIELNSLEFI